MMIEVALIALLLVMFIPGYIQMQHDDWDDDVTTAQIHRAAAHSRRWLAALLAIFLMVGLQDVHPAEKAGKYLIPPYTLSPDHRYGVTVPIWDAVRNTNNDIGNHVIELRTGRLLAPIHGETGYDRALNFRRTLPARWSKDSTILLWEVAGKWFPDAFVLLKMEKGKAKWQIDLLKAAQQSILIRTKKTDPEKFERVKKAIGGYTVAPTGAGSAYPEGFTVDMRVPQGPLSLPLHLQAVLTANPKQIEGYANLDSRLEAVIDNDGTFVVTHFQMEREHAYNGGGWNWKTWEGQHR